MRSSKLIEAKSGCRRKCGHSCIAMKLMAGFALFAVLILSGCIESWSSYRPQTQYVRVFGTVRQVPPFVHVPIQGAIVRIAGPLGPADTTDEQGHYSIMHLSGAGYLPIDVERDGYQSYADSLYIGPDDLKHEISFHKDILLKRMSAGGN